MQHCFDKYSMASVVKFQLSFYNINSCGLEPCTDAACLQGSTKCLETLNLGHNSVTNEGIHILKEGLLKSKSLMRLGLQSTRLTCEGNGSFLLTVLLYSCSF